MFCGCVDEQTTDAEIADTMFLSKDYPSVLPDWQDGEYHDYQKTVTMLNFFEETYPQLVEVFSIGKSTRNHDIWCIRITNEQSNFDKLSCLIDGCIHGKEWESAEACLYLTEYLLINYGKNQTISTIVNQTDIYIVPIVNPDGRIADDRYTDNGVDPNRNFDVFFGRLFRGHSFRLGKLFNRIKLPVIKIPRDDPANWFYNCGKFPFSEPETKALSSFIRTLAQGDMAFYVNTHTPAYLVVTPWLSFKPPFQLSTQQRSVFSTVIEWVERYTEYGGIFGQDIDTKTGGNAMDWCFKEFQIPSFTYELLTMEYYSFQGAWKHDHLVHWMQSSLPFYMYLLVNTENLYRWDDPTNHPLLPEGIPPEPLD